MELLLGSGKMYEFLANKITHEYTGDLLQIGPQYFGRLDENSVNEWVQFTSEVDEAKFIIRSSLETKETKYNQIYVCIPNKPPKDPNALEWSFNFIDLLRDHVISYAYLLKNLITYKTTLIIINELTNDAEFEVALVNNVLRPIFSTAIQGTGSTLLYYTAAQLSTKTLEEWWSTTFNWRVK